MPPRIYYNTDNIDRVILKIPANRQKLVKSIAFQVEALAKTKAPVDTGALRNSIYTSLQSSNNPPTESIETLPTPDSDTKAFVGPTVEYAIYQELGTQDIPAQPFLLPAIRNVEEELERFMREFING